MSNNHDLISSNMRLVYHIIAKEYPRYLYDEDIIQTGMLGLCQAAERWDEQRGSFPNYAGSWIRGEIKQELIRRKKHSENISLDTKISEDGTLEDVLVGEEDVEYIDDAFYRELTELEQNVFTLNTLGLTTNEIATKLNCNVNKIRKILRTIRLKWRNFDGH